MVPPRQLEQVPLEVARDGDVHGRGGGLRHGRLVVLPRAEEAVQDVVHVRRHQLFVVVKSVRAGRGDRGQDEAVTPSMYACMYVCMWSLLAAAHARLVARAHCTHQLLDGQAHALGVVARQDVPEVAGGDGEGERLDGGVGVRDAEVGPEVVGDLRQDACPVDGVDGPQVHRLPEGLVLEAGLDDVLAVVEGALDGHALHVLVRHSRHLALLDGRRAALGVQDEAPHVRLAAQPVDGRRA